MYDTPPVDESSTSSNNDSNMETHSSALHSKESSPANALDEGTIAYVPLGNGDTMMSSYSAQENTADKSFTVYSVNVDKTPDTSDLPYRQPTRTPTPKPTSSPTDVEIKYYYPIWADNVKGCSSSGEPPSAVSSDVVVLVELLCECYCSDCVSSLHLSNSHYQPMIVLHWRWRLSV